MSIESQSTLTPLIGRPLRRSRRSCISWRDEYALGARALCKFPGECMFTATIADHQNVHNIIPQLLVTTPHLRDDSVVATTRVILACWRRKRIHSLLHEQRHCPWHMTGRSDQKNFMVLNNRFYKYSLFIGIQ